MRKIFFALAALFAISASAQIVVQTDTVVKDGKQLVRKVVEEIVDGTKVVGDSLFVDGRFMGLTCTNWWTYEGKRMPRFEVKSEDGTTITSESLLGKTVVISFWIPTCGPCLKELRRVGPEIIDRHSPDSLVVLAVGAGCTAKDAVAFRQKAGATFPLCYDETGTVMPLFADQGCPKVFVIDSTSLVRFAEKGYSDEKFEELKRKIEEVMR